MNRRQFLHVAGSSAAILTLGRVAGAEEKKVEYTLPKLPYAYDALEPHIDAKTMMIHHDKHHQAYITGLIAAMAKAPAELQGKPVEELLKGIDKVPMDIRQAVINTGGGHANHTMFWEIMGPKAGGTPTGALAKAIDGAFESFDKFQAKFTQAAMTRFGSGWAWLVVAGGKLDVLSSGNQDSPLMKGQTPILGIDVWEHAYYLKYQNLRADYVKAWWNVVNWSNVSERAAAAMKG
jgi:superoxide dismutase, Fe-Mn family